MPRRTPPTAAGLPTLWMEYKGLCSRCLPGRAATLIQGRHFDRLLLAYVVHGLVVAGVLALGIALWPDALPFLTGGSAAPHAAAPPALPTDTP